MLNQKSLVEGIGLAAVIASLLFVAFEIRQSNRIAIGTTAYELNRNWMAINELYLTDPKVLELIVAVSDKEFIPKDEEQREQVEAFARLILNNWIAIEDAYNNGIASEILYLLALEDVKAVISKRPGLLPTYVAVTSHYDLSKYKLLEPLFVAIAQSE